jgi:hypothetical protein
VAPSLRKGDSSFVSADLNRGAFAPLVSDKPQVPGRVYLGAVGGTQPPAGAPPVFPAGMVCEFCDFN